MRWLGIIALFLLALVPISSSDGDKSTSIFPFAAPSVKNETDDSTSLPNSLSISTIPTDTEAPLTSSAVEPPVGNLSTANTVLEGGMMSEQGTEIEYSSTNNVLELTKSREYNEETNDDEAASSEADDVQADPSRSRDIESQPQSAESPPAQASNSSDLDKYSADELEVKLNEAKTALDGAKNATESVKKARDSKQEELKKANDDYEEKKKKWENLDNIAKAKAEIWTEAEQNAKDANSEYDTAKTSFNNADHSLITEQGVLNEFPAKIGSATEKIEIIKKRPERLNELKTTRTNKINGKPQLQPTINRLSSEETAKKDAWESARDKFEATKAKYELDNCNDPTKALPSCPATAASKAKYEPLVGPAKEAYEQAEKVLAEARKELADYNKDLRAIENEISKLEALEKHYDRDLGRAEEELKSVEDEQDSVKAEVEYWEGVKKTAEEDQELKRLANETAYEKVKNGQPPEINAANNEATGAFITMDSANDTRIKEVEELKQLETDLNSAKATETNLESEVGKLENAYAEARKKEEVKTGSGVGLGVGLGIGGLLLVIGIGIGIFFLCRHMKKKGNGPDDKKKPKKGDVKSRMPSTLTSKGPDVQPVMPTESSTTVQNNVGSGGSTPVAGAPVGVPVTPIAPRSRAVVPADQTPTTTREPNYQCNRDEIPPKLPNYAKTPFIPGEKPFKIPAKNFTWRGKHVSKSRYHGEPKHKLEGKKGPEKLEDLWFDPNANFATEIGHDIIEDGGPPSDSPRSEWLNRVDEWENAHNAMVSADEADARPNQTPSQKEDSKNKRKKFVKLSKEHQDKDDEDREQRAKEKAKRKRPGKGKKSKGSRSK